jgi:WD40 repeat protein
METIASVSNDKTIKLWEVATGRVKQTLIGHQDWANSVSFSPDGQMIASASLDQTIRLWTLDLDRLMQTGCNHIRTYLKTRPEQQDLCKGYL